MTPLDEEARDRILNAMRIRERIRQEGRAEGIIEGRAHASVAFEERLADLLRRVSVLEDVIAKDVTRAVRRQEPDAEPGSRSTR